MIYIWAVNGSQNQVMAVRRVNVDHQGFVDGYDIKICVTVFFINKKTMFYEEVNSITLNFEIYFLGKKRFVQGNYVKIIFF